MFSNHYQTAHTPTPSPFSLSSPPFPQFISINFLLNITFHRLFIENHIPKVLSNQQSIRQGASGNTASQALSAITTVLRVKPFVLRVKQKYYYILMYCFTRKTNCFTRKTLVDANRVRIHLLRVKRIVLRVKPIVLRVKQKYYYILMYCFTRKVNCFTRKDKSFTRKTLDKWSFWP